MFQSELTAPKLWLCVWLAMILTVIIGSLLPAADVPLPMMNGADKLVHALGYLVLSGMASSVFAGKTRGRVLLALVVLGGLIEIAQGTFTSSRYADVRDFFANSLGVIVGALLFKQRGPRILQAIERRFRSSPVN